MSGMWDWLCARQDMLNAYPTLGMRVIGRQEDEGARKG